MALVGVAIAGAVASTIAAIVTNNRWTDIINRTARTIITTVDGEEVTIRPGYRYRFKVKQDTPVRIKILWQKYVGIYLEYNFNDYNHRDFYVTEYNGGIQLISY